MAGTTYLFTRRHVRIITYVALVLVLAGLGLGLLPVSSGGSSCGSAFFASSSLDLPGSCDDLRSLFRVPALTLLSLGVVVGMIGVFENPGSSSTS